MSISRAGWAALASAVIVSACAETATVPTPAPAQDAEVADRALPYRETARAVLVSQSDVTIAGPPGFCVDAATAQDRSAGSFVMLGSCAALSGDGAVPDNPAVLTALVASQADPALSPGPAELETFFRGAAGQAALAFDGQADSVTLFDVEPEEDALYLRVRDRSEDRPDELSNQSWRAVFTLMDRLVVLSATSHADLQLDSATLRRVLEDFVEAVRRANLGDTVAAEEA